MALPVSISNAAFPSDSISNLGPFISSGGNVYFVAGNGASPTENVWVWKATDPTSSFTQQTNLGALTNNTIGSLSAVQDGDLLHVVFQFNPSGDVYYREFNMATDTNNTGAASTLHTPTDDPTTFAVDITVRSDGDIIAVYHGENPTTMGGTYQEIAYSRYEASWTNGTVVASTAAKDDNYLYPKVVMGSSDQCHFGYFRDTDGDFYLRALSSGNSLRTQRSQAATMTSPDSVMGAGTYTRSSTEKIVFVIEDVGFDRIDFTHFTDDTNPTFDVDAIDNAGTSADSKNYGFAVDSGDTNQPNFFGRCVTTTIELYTDSGSETWTTEAADITTGTPTSVDGLSGNIYTRGTDVVYAFVYDDSGTIYYDEYVIRTTGGGGSGSIKLAGTGGLAGAGGLAGMGGGLAG